MRAVVERLLKPIYRVAVPATLALSAAWASGESDQESVRNSQEPTVAPIARNHPLAIPASQDYSVIFVSSDTKETEHALGITMEPDLSANLQPEAELLPTADSNEETPTTLANTPADLSFNFEGFVPYKMDSCDTNAWEPLDRATFVEIPAIDFAGPVQLAEQVPVSEGSAEKVLVTPPTGIATPKHAIHNAVHIYGHSFAGSERQPFADIEKLEEGNLIKVTDEDNEQTCFEVSEFALVNKESVQTLRGPSDKPRVIGQTSFIYKGNVLLNEQNVLEKVGENKPEDISGGAAFFVIADPVGETEEVAP
jgi:sortase (surface protein transpeptidase)